MNTMKQFHTHTISITSGKGGVGKTSLTANMALTLADRGNRVLILDGDMGMANVDLFFGVKPQGTLHDLLTESKSIHEILTPLSKNIDLVSGGSGFAELNRLNRFERKAIVDAVMDLEYRYDFLLIDTSPGLSDNVLYLNAAAETMVLVLTPDPASMTDSYALMKVLHQEYKRNRFTVLCNQVRDESEGLSLYSRFSDVANRFLNVGLDYLGAVPMDASLRRATQLQRLILRHDPSSVSAGAIRQVTHQLEKTLSQNSTLERSGVFWEQVMGVA